MDKHDKLLKQLLQRPRSSNICWSDIESMLIHFGAKIREGKGSAISIILRGHIAVFHRPHPSNKADKGAIDTVIKFLKRANILKKE